MKRGVQRRVLLLGLFVLVSFVYFLPSTPYYSGMPDWWKAYMPERGVILGLDLQGGIHMVLEVEEDKAVENLVERSARSVAEFLKEEGEEIESSKRTDLAEFTITVKDPTKKEEIQRKVEDNYPNYFPKESEPDQILFRLREGEAARIKDSATSQVLETIRNRIDQFGVTEPLIQRQGQKQIVIQLPGVKDANRAKELIGKTALLEFKMLDEESPFGRTLPVSIKGSREEEFFEEYGGQIPEGDEILFERQVDSETGEVSKTPHLIKKASLMTGDVLTDARVSIDEFNQPYVSITLDGTGAKLFEKITAANIGKRLAIVLDNNVYSAPVIQSRIPGGRGQITGSFTTDEANDLAVVLRAGALPAPVRTIQDLTVGPSLGQDSIRKGVQATVFGGILVILFMAVYYRLSGLIADFALILNLIVLVGALAALNATLTLPGIAGIILTIGIGVDSNVLIFERIREELRQGKPVRLAVDGGYGKALITIIDSHVTTLITALVLFLFGTGPIKGFAITLSLGITINLFTALVGTKVVFDFINNRWRLKRLSI
ncbi:MAG TPA: protein translocase subunit SecD [Nitrospiria bacterium]